MIDPAVTYATFLGGAALDDGYAIAVDGSGNAYVTGQTKSYPFPSATGTNTGFFDVFVTEISADGSTIVYSTLVGGSGSGDGDSSGNAIALDSAGNAYVAGGTAASTGFPTTAGLYQPNFGAGSLDGFVFKLDSKGALKYVHLYWGNLAMIWSTASQLQVLGCISGWTRPPET